MFSISLGLGAGDTLVKASDDWTTLSWSFYLLCAAGEVWALGRGTPWTPGSLVSRRCPLKTERTGLGIESVRHQLLQEDVIIY